MAPLSKRCSPPKRLPPAAHLQPARPPRCHHARRPAAAVPGCGGSQAVAVCVTALRATWQARSSPASLRPATMCVPACAHIDPSSLRKVQYLIDMGGDRLTLHKTSKAPHARPLRGSPGSTRFASIATRPWPARQHAAPAAHEVAACMARTLPGVLTCSTKGEQCQRASIAGTATEIERNSSLRPVISPTGVAPPPQAQLHRPEARTAAASRPPRWPCRWGRCPL